MHDNQLNFQTDLTGLDTNVWLGKIDDICDELGFFEQLGKRHFAGFLQAGPQLLVTFENAETARDRNPDAAPRGFSYARHDGWSHLALLSNGESWFRDTAVYDFFDRLIDDGFFEHFETTVFYGSGSGGYAAAAFSVAAPGATVIALRPQATLDARTAGWDPRYKSHRRLDFLGRYGYAPEMIEAASDVFIAYDPFQQLDAGHATLFRKPHVTLLPCPLFGNDLERAFDRMGIHDAMLKLAMDQSLDARRFAKLLRARRHDQRYTRTLVRWLVTNGHPQLAAMVCRHMLARGPNDFFANTLKKLDETKPA